jgi:hypothetical protein
MGVKLSSPIQYGSHEQLFEKVARERFELSSAGPKPAMLDHYTTGLQHNLIGVPDDKVLRPKLLLISILRFFRNRQRLIVISVFYTLLSKK